MRFTIVTPSFRNSRWLKLCIPSVADQQIELEHIVQDSCSDDGTQEWLPQDRRVTAVIEKDRGMYDAVTRGWKRACGDILAYLNCDEQYLPGALAKVSGFFDRHPEVDAVFGDVVVVDRQGGYVCDRTALTPQLAHALVSRNLSFLTAGAFVRRAFVERHQLYFNPRWRIVGDCEWAGRLIRCGARMARLARFTSTFTETGQNLALSENTKNELAELAQGTSGWMRRLRPLVVAHFRLRRLLSGAYRCRPYQYAIYTEASPDRRHRFQVDKPTFRWRRPGL